MRPPFTRRRFINCRFVGPVLVYVATAIAIIAVVVHVARHGDRNAPSHVNAVHISSNDALARKLAHCQAIGERAANDMACIAAWSENRHRFFEGGAPAGHAATPAPANPEGAPQP